MEHAVIGNTILHCGSEFMSCKAKDFFVLDYVTKTENGMDSFMGFFPVYEWCLEITVFTVNVDDTKNKHFPNFVGEFFFFNIF